MTRARVGAPSPLLAVRPWPALGTALAGLGLALAPAPAAAQAPAAALSAAAAQAPRIADFAPVTDAMLRNPAPEDWLMWRRTLDAWGYSPLDRIDRSNVGDLRLAWTRALTPGSEQGTPLAHRGVLYHTRSPVAASMAGMTSPGFGRAAAERGQQPVRVRPA